MDTDDVPVWCPLCSHPLHNPDGVAVVTCDACRLPVRWESARHMAQGWAALHEAGDRARQAEGQLAEAEAAVAAAREQLAAAENVTAAWRSYSLAEMRTLAAGTAPVPEPTTPPPHTGRTHTFPIAVILQAAGALLLLAAVVVASAVLWGFLSPLGQAGFLLAIVAAAGLVAVVIGRRLPTTGIVLAALTVALAVVVAITLPSRLPALDASWYPTIALILSAAGFYLVGAWARVQLWQHVGVAAIPLIVAVAVTTFLPSLANLDGPLWLALAASAFLAAAVALRFAGAQTDVDTAITARIGSYLSAGLGALLAAVAFLAGLGGTADWRALLGETVAIMLLGFYCHLLSQGVKDRTSGMVVVWRSLAVLVLTPLPALLLVPGEVEQWWVAVILGVAAVGVVGAWTWWAPRARQTRDLPEILVTPGISLAVAALWLFAALGLFAEAREGSWVWLLGAITGLGWSAVFLAAGLLRHNLASLLSGWCAGVIAWLLLSLTGHTGDTVEAAFLPIIAASLVLWWSARVRAVPGIAAMPSAAAQVIVLVGTLPLAIAGWAPLLFEERFLPRLLVWSIVAVLVAGILAWRQRTVWLVTATGSAVLWWPWAVSAQVHATQQSLERYTLPAACAVLIVALAGAHDRLWRRSTAVLVAAGVALVPSSVAALALSIDWGEPPTWRSVIVLSIWGWAAVWFVRRRPTIATLAWVVVTVLSCWWAMVALFTGPVSGPERMTMPLAVGAVLITGWVRYPRTLTMWWSRVLAIPLIAVLSVSTLVSVIADPESAGLADWIRATVCVFAWVVLTWGCWRRPWWAVGFGVVTALFGWLTMVRALIAADYSGPVEVYTLSAAVAVAFATYLFTRAVTWHIPSILTLGPTLALVLWPSAMLAWTGDELGWRIWIALILSAVALVVGVVFRRAGVLVPGLVGIVLVTLPVFLQVVSDLPAWLPLSVVGLILVGIGARFEAVRRGSVEAFRWARHLQ